ncbi:cysteine dioxygenase type 1 [Zootermopsis nevadensis]|uniref:Cysteine dioxygenase n=1 Tax=Zootermopsis nevadensis TaxID=136037 RepID=A0A067R3M6_ZOONE|nr:cysteine dioxygenase type 1 [Zootermopsis nevadensis]XP_021923432.1 cysteine dioxygenase type 1 [Zootermopsis nevadensis]KDR17630.1 Cysteine dioxygenase type 1 [Zootermopsis nevadensis]
MDTVMQNPRVGSYSEGPFLKYKPCVQTPVVSTLDDLIRELYVVFNSDSVNVEFVHQLMSIYKSNPAEWKRFAKFDRFRYTRNLVDDGNGKFNLLILCWGEGHGSPIHDHADSHCFMKILEGSLSEVRFTWPKSDAAAYKQTINSSNECKNLKEISRGELHLNEVAYINDSIGLHRVENLSNVNPAVSLHLYSPPFNKCKVFDQQTGHSTSTKVTFWSKFGEKWNRDIQSSHAPEDD